MIREITLENFRNFQDPVSLRISPITLLIGPNNSGKSNILRFLEIVRAAVLKDHHHIPMPDILGEVHNLNSSTTRTQFDLAVSPEAQPRRFHLAGSFDCSPTDDNSSPAGTDRVWLGVTDQEDQQPRYWDPDTPEPDRTPLAREFQEQVLEAVWKTVGTLIPITPGDNEQGATGKLLDALTSQPGELKAAADRAGIAAPDQASLLTMGRGSKRTLLMTWAMGRAPRGATVTLQNPEDGLDPAAQLHLGSIIAQLRNESELNFVIETQSDNLLLQLRYLAARGDIQPQDVTVAFFTNHGKDGSPMIRNIGVRPDGSLEPGLPMSFFGIDIIRAIEMGNLPDRARP